MSGVEAALDLVYCVNAAVGAMDASLLSLLEHREMIFMYIRDFL